MTRDYVIDELPLSQGFAFLAWNTQNNPWCQMQLVSDGYIAQERHRSIVGADVRRL